MFTFLRALYQNKHYVMSHSEAEKPFFSRRVRNENTEYYPAKRGGFPPYFKYSRTSVARTLMARLPRLFRTRSKVPRKKSDSCIFGMIN